MAALLLMLVLALVPAARAAAPRASFNDIEDEVMCVTCNVPLNIANSPQAEDERTEIKRLIALGLTKQQVLDRLKADLGPEVLADPPRDGFTIPPWLAPIAAIGGVALLLVLTGPRWRRGGGADPAGDAAGAWPEQSPDELRRLDVDPARPEV
jgi:cytochrome c-type biogenesis protein CcmH